MDEVDARSWAKLGREAGYSARFAETTTSSVIERTVEAAERLSAELRHDNDVAKSIATSIYERATA